jgi:D-alanine-D-alanine ligase
MRVLVLHDQVSPAARADELDILVQAESIAQALRGLGHDVSRLDFPLDLEGAIHEIRARRPDVVFNLVESVMGTGRLVYLAPAILDSAGVSYTGGTTEALFLTSNKILTKKWLRRHGMETPDWWDLQALETLERRAEKEPLPRRVIVKSVWEDASVGLDGGSVIEVGGPGSLRRVILERRPRLGGEAFAEEYIEGREFNVSLLAGGDGPNVLPVAEIEFVDYPPEKPKVLDYSAKWKTDSFEYRNTVRRFDFPDRDRTLVERLARMAQDCWSVFGLSGYARVDFRVDAGGRPWLLEINSNPCLSPDAGFIAAAGRGGLSFADVVQRIVESANRR